MTSPRLKFNSDSERALTLTHTNTLTLILTCTHKQSHTIFINSYENYISFVIDKEFIFYHLAIKPKYKKKVADKVWFKISLTIKKSIGFILSDVVNQKLSMSSECQIT